MLVELAERTFEAERDILDMCFGLLGGCFCRLFGSGILGSRGRGFTLCGLFLSSGSLVRSLFCRGSFGLFRGGLFALSSGFPGRSSGGFFRNRLFSRRPGSGRFPGCRGLGRLGGSRSLFGSRCFCGSVLGGGGIRSRGLIVSGPGRFGRGFFCDRFSRSRFFGSRGLSGLGLCFRGCRFGSGFGAASVVAASAAGAADSVL
ncbi:hypothetical protein ACFSS8_00740 [Paracoccus kondratievae]